MTTNPRAKKFRIRRSGSLNEGQPERSAPPPDPAATEDAPPHAGNRDAQFEQASPAEPVREGQIDSPAAMVAQTDMDAIRAEGLTGRQLRLARRMAQKHGIAATSDFDAVRQLRLNGINPFQRSNILELVSTDGGANVQSGISDDPGQGSGQLGRIQLPQTVPHPDRNLPSTERAKPSETRFSEIVEIQRDIAKRRRRKVALLFTRLAFFVMLPTIVAGWYYYFVATPMYATNSEFVIQQAEGRGASGLGSLFQGTSMATQQDSITVQSYLASRAAMVRLDQDHGFKSHFSGPDIDPIQALAPDASNEEAYAVYQDHVKISYDPTEGIVKMEVSAPDPQTSQLFSEALIHYAEEQVDQLTQRLREDQMSGARDSYEQAEARRTDALNELLKIQNDVEVIDPVGESGALLQQISTLESQRQQKVLELTSLLNATRPNEGRVQGVRSEIEGFETLIAQLRSQMTQNDATGSSLAVKNTELRLAEENYQFQTIMVQQALQLMEASRIEANRQVRYLSLGVEPIAPDEPTYPRSFENTLLAFLVFAGIYLMISLTGSILREQISS